MKKFNESSFIKSLFLVVSVLFGSFLAYFFVFISNLTQTKAIFISTVLVIFVYIVMRVWLTKTLQPGHFLYLPENKEVVLENKGAEALVYWKNKYKNCQEMKYETRWNIDTFLEFMAGKRRRTIFCNASLIFNRDAQQTLLLNDFGSDQISLGDEIINDWENDFPQNFREELVDLANFKEEGRQIGYLVLLRESFVPHIQKIGHFEISGYFNVN